MNFRNYISALQGLPEEQARAKAIQLLGCIFGEPIFGCMAEDLGRVQSLLGLAESANMLSWENKSIRARMQVCPYRGEAGMWGELVPEGLLVTVRMDVMKFQEGSWRYWNIQEVEGLLLPHWGENGSFRLINCLLAMFEVWGSILLKDPDTQLRELFLPRSRHPLLKLRNRVHQDYQVGFSRALDKLKSP